MYIHVYIEIRSIGSDFFVQYTVLNWVHTMHIYVYIEIHSIRWVFFWLMYSFKLVVPNYIRCIFMYTDENIGQINTLHSPLFIIYFEHLSRMQFYTCFLKE